jgi:ferredoxin
VPAVAVTRHRARALGGHGTLMARCLAIGLPVASSCSGRGACGRCAVEILSGAEGLEAADPHEQRVLRLNQLPEGWRLSCQCRVRDAAADLRISTGYW